MADDVVVEPTPDRPTDNPAGIFGHAGALGLPEGSVRALLAITVIGSNLFMQCFYKWSPASLDTMAAMAFAWYFGSAVSAASGKAAKS